MRETMQVGELFSIIAKRKLIVIATTITFMILGLLYSIFLVTPVYKADTTIIVGIPGIEAGTITVNQTIAITYEELVKSRTVLQTVIDELDLKVPYENLFSRTSVDVIGTTELIKMSVKDADREKAILISEKIIEVFQREVQRTLGLKNITIVDKAAASENTANRGPITNTILATLIGLILGVLIALIVDYADKSIQTEQDIDEYVDGNLKVIGSIPKFK